MRQKEFKTTASSKGPKHKRRITFIVNIALLLLGIAMSVSGLIIQYNYHLQKSPAESVVLALDRTEWNAVHVWTSFGFLVFAVYHIWAHRVWYGNVLKKKLIPKHRQTVVLTLLTLIVVISGLIPLLIYYLGGNPVLRFSIIEIHDKVAILFFLFVFFHTVKRSKWYFNVIKSKL